MKTRRERLNRSGLPKGAVASYIKGKSCGRGKHSFVIAKSVTYAVCTRCHLRLVLVPEERNYDPGEGQEGYEDEHSL